MHNDHRTNLKEAGMDVYVTSGQIYRVLIQLAKQATPVMADHLYVAAKACESLSDRGVQVVDIANEAH